MQPKRYLVHALSEISSASALQSEGEWIASELAFNLVSLDMYSRVCVQIHKAGETDQSSAIISS